MIGRSDGREDNRNFRLYLIEDALYIGLLPVAALLPILLRTCWPTTNPQSQNMDSKTRAYNANKFRVLMLHGEIATEILSLTDLVMLLTRIFLNRFRE